MFIDRPRVPDKVHYPIDGHIFRTFSLLQCFLELNSLVLPFEHEGSRALLLCVVSSHAAQNSTMKKKALRNKVTAAFP